VFTVSIHEADLWPPEKPPNDLDVGLKLPVDDATYLAAMAERLPPIVRDFKPELLIFIAGADVQAGDIHGHFALTPEGILRRDEYVTSLARSGGVPLVYLIGGGYFPSAWKTQAASIGNLLVKFAGVRPASREASGAPAWVESRPAQPLR
jgi:acetoin utilization deacetylase AcuC-like enzyme